MNKNIIVNLTGGKRVNSLILLSLCLKNELKALYINIKKKIMYEFENNVTIFDKSFEDLEIDDIVKASGGKIVEDSSELCNKEDLIYFAEKISSNLELWHKYKQQLYEANIFEHDTNDGKRIYIHTEGLEEDEVKLLNKILSKLVEMKEINYKKQNDKITVNFNNNYLKAFIFKSGTWLEVLTKNIIEEIKSIDDIKSGVLFLWNDKESRVKNELDVVAIKDSVLICVSCKDSKKYDEVALNELNVYSEQLGGENVIKILVATHPPIKSSISKRAKEMGINLVVFDGNKKAFKEELEKIIK